MTINIGPIVSIAISQIKPNARNAKTHSANQIRQIANSIAAFGFTNPLLLGEDLELIAGFGRYRAANVLGFTEVPARIVAGLSSTKRRALAIADNKIAQNSKWNRERLAIEIPELTESLAAEGLDVSILGFGSVEIDSIIEADVAKPAPEGDGFTDKKWFVASTTSKPGDLWILGHHRLLCAQASPDADIMRLMAGSRADMVYVDPRTAKKAWTPDLANLLSETVKAAASSSRAGAYQFVCAGWQHFAALIETVKPVYGAPVDVAVWVKAKAYYGDFYRNQHEFVVVFRTGEIPSLDVGRNQHARANVWHYSEAKSPTTGTGIKPVAFIADLMKDSTVKGDTVLDAFSGSGNTILAAENLGRHARALERDAQLVDFAIRRWQDAARRKAIHADTGMSFDEVAADSEPSAPLTEQSPTARRT